MSRDGKEYRIDVEDSIKDHVEGIARALNTSIRTSTFIHRLCGDVNNTEYVDEIWVII